MKKKKNIGKTLLNFVNVATFLCISKMSKKQNSPLAIPWQRILFKVGVHPLMNRSVFDRSVVTGHRFAVFMNLSPLLVRTKEPLTLGIDVILQS